MSVWVIVVAAGSGSRFGSAKQYAALGDRRVIDWSLETAAAVAEGVIAVVAGDKVDVDLPADHVVAGGTTRSASVRAGLERVPADAEVVLVHDAARPLASRELFESVIEAVRAGADAVVPGIAVVDTIKRVDRQPTAGSPAFVLATVDRADLVAVQTPQGFRASALREAHASSAHKTDDAAVVEEMGGKVVVVHGEAANIKITVPHDLDTLNAVVGR